MNKLIALCAAACLGFFGQAGADQGSEDVLLAEMIDHARQWESRILEEGRPLSERETRLASEAGVMHPDKVRVIVRESIPVPQSGSLQSWLAGLGMLEILREANGAARGYGIIVRKGNENSDLVITHELVHVAQYEGLGGLEAMFATYLQQLKGNEYRGVGLEEEAFRQTREILWRFSD